MGLGDLFKPKWKHSDREKRLEAVKELDDQKILAQIVENDSDKLIRNEAFQKITDEGILSDIAKNASNKETRLNAIKKINDDAVLIDIIKNSDDSIRSRLDSIKKIDNKNGIYDKELYEIYNNDDNLFVRQEAINRISDEYLIKILKNTEDTKHCLSNEKAIKNKSFINNKLLINIAKNSTNMEYAMEAIKMITDKSLITDEIMIPIANNGSWPITEEAVGYIKDKSYLMKIARTHPKWQIDTGAYRRYVDDPDMSRVHESDKIYPVREAAEWRLDRLLKEGVNYNKFKSLEGSDYCENCFEDIPKGRESCPYCGSINITRR